VGSVVCVGLTTLDVVQVTDRLPGPDEKRVASDGWVTFGGPAANAAATCAALRVSVRLVSAIGSGPAADLARAGLAQAGVEVIDLAPRSPDLLPVSSVLITGAQRAVVSRNAEAAPDLAAAAAQVGAAGPGDVVLVDGHHLGAAVSVARRSRARGATVLADGGSWRPGLPDLLAHVDVAVLSAGFRLPRTREDGASPAPDLLAAVAALGPAVVAQTHGAGPVRVLVAPGPGAADRPSPGPGAHRGVVTQVQPPPVAVVDTLGAGDVLHGAVAAALAGGADVLAAVTQGVQVASRSVQARGALGWAVGEPGRGTGRRTSVDSSP